MRKVTGMTESERESEFWSTEEIDAAFIAAQDQELSEHAEYTSADKSLRRIVVATLDAAAKHRQSLAGFIAGLLASDEQFARGRGVVALEIAKYADQFILARREREPDLESPIVNFSTDETKVGPR
jgi:hypothetical protein